MSLRTLCASLAGLLAVDACAGLPLQPPGSRFDLSDWKLTLPDRRASEVAAPALARYASDYFHLAEDGSMVFVAPVGGGTTENSRFPRSELREMLDPRDDNRNWSGSGKHLLTATCQVVRAPAEQKVIVGQIHGFEARPLVKLQWEKGRVKALIKRSPEGDNGDITHLFAARVDNRPFSYRIEVNDGRLGVQVEGERIEHDFFQASPAWRDVDFYFKAGAYVQSAKKANGESAEVRFSALSVAHPR